jgi:hypothetical protein
MFNKVETELIRKCYKKIKAINYLGGKCSVCSDTDIRHLAFHHLDPNEKENEMNKLLFNSWNTIEEEIKKCILMCHNCHNEHHSNNDDKCRRVITKKTFLEYKGGSCKKCGYNKCSASLAFHHLDKTTKLFRLSRARHVFRSVCDITEKFVEELDKCELLCSNCHSEEHIRQDLLDYTIENFSSLNFKTIAQKYDRDIIEDLYFNQNKTQKEITQIIGIKKSTLSGIIKTLTETKKAS